MQNNYFQETGDVKEINQIPFLKFEVHKVSYEYPDNRVCQLSDEWERIICDYHETENRSLQTQTSHVYQVPHWHVPRVPHFPHNSPTPQNLRAERYSLLTQQWRKISLDPCSVYSTQQSLLGFLQLMSVHSKSNTLPALLSGWFQLYLAYPVWENNYCYVCLNEFLFKLKPLSAPNSLGLQFFSSSFWVWSACLFY